MNQLRISLLENLGQSSEVMPILNKLQFGQMSFLYSVYQLESIRLNVVTNVLIENMFEYLEDRAVQKDKTGEQSIFCFDFLFKRLYRCCPVTFFEIIIMMVNTIIIIRFH